MGGSGTVVCTSGFDVLGIVFDEGQSLVAKVDDNVRFDSNLGEVQGERIDKTRQLLSAVVE